MNIVRGNLLTAPEQYICHQCNCVSSRAAHLAASMFAHFPHANIYLPRATRNRDDPLPPGEGPGDIIVRGDGVKERYVIALLAQYFPGKPRYPDSGKDSYRVRQRYFREALQKVKMIPGIQSLGLPWQIGCGAAGGDWEVYQGIIEDVLGDSGINVVCYRLPGM